LELEWNFEIGGWSWSGVGVGVGFLKIRAELPGVGAVHTWRCPSLEQFISAVVESESLTLGSTLS